jgi:hypothetical protein
VQNIVCAKKWNFGEFFKWTSVGLNINKLKHRKKKNQIELKKTFQFCHPWHTFIIIIILVRHMIQTIKKSVIIMN